MNETMNELLALLVKDGAAQYGYEPVTQLAHGLQAAKLAEDAGEPPALIAAALLHDIGHLVEGADVRLLELQEDDHHEDRSAQALATCFPPAVVEPVRWHVRAKRYLCFAEAGYYEQLSDASRQSLALQGGPMNAREAEEFLRLPYAGDAVRLRRYDDRAKNPAAKTPPPAHFVAYVAQVATLPK